MRYKPTSEECKVIRSQCLKMVPGNRVVIRPGTRRHLTKDRGEHMNIALVTDNPRHHSEDTDLWDKGTWVEFRKGFELSDDRIGIVDFYVYSVEQSGRDIFPELEFNCVAYFDRKGMTEVDFGLGKVWRAKRAYYSYLPDTYGRPGLNG